jgi:death-on-curing protein
MRYLTLPEVLILHDRIITTTGGSSGIRDLSALESALAQPQATFDGDELYPDLVAKAATLGYLIVANHPFIDGNKRVGHAAMEVFLVLNGREIEANVDDQERLILAVASGQLDRLGLEQWLLKHTTIRK